MAGMKRNGAAKSKTGTDNNVGKNRHICRPNDALVMTLHEIFPRKADMEIALLADISPRSAQRYLSKKADVSGSVLIELLRSDVGQMVLESVMSGAEAPWWRAFRRHLEVAIIAKNHAETGKRLRALIAGDEPGERE